ncbi:MobV family relaxase, partial [Klebsiella grimontii]|uniref:MobV family relaxase n=1 Tax=Klebsiella grimontii TaxID=2058152 RepID=UPI002114B778
MSKIVARMEKMKDGNLSGIQRHNQRETNNHSNPDIDIEKSHLNYDLVNPGSINYREKIKQIIESQRISKRAVRKDAVLVNEWIITSDTAFFQENTDTQAFFTDVVAYFSDRCGRQNVAYATVHLDETTPHMHLGIVPMYEGRLSSKQVFSRQNLLEIQEELPTYLQERGYAIERGLRGSPQKQELANQEQILAEKERELHSYEQAIFRIDRLLEEKNEEVKGKVQAMNQLETKRNEIINSLQTTVLPDLANVKEKKFSLNGLKYVLSASDFSAIKSITKDFETLRTQNKHLKIENNNLAQKNKELTQVNHEQELQITELAYELTLKKEQLTAFEEK